MKTGYKKSKVEKSIGKAYLGDMPEMKPTISIDENQLPEIKNWKIGKTYMIELSVELTGLHKKYDSDMICADFEIKSAETDEDD